METNPIRTEANRKEIRCSDCDHLYIIAHGQKSSRCSQCGNIEFHSDNAEPLRDLASPIEMIKNRVLEKVKIPIKKNGASSLLENFQKPADGKKVEEILVAYQVEWQLWANLVKNFSDANFHAAYLSHIVMKKNFDLASERYRAHRSAMALLKEELWQAEIADVMLARIETISLVGMEMEGRGFSLPRFLYLLPLQSRATKVGFFVVAFYLLFKIVLK